MLVKLGVSEGVNKVYRVKIVYSEDGFDLEGLDPNYPRHQHGKNSERSVTELTYQH